jgi:transposase
MHKMSLPDNRVLRVTKYYQDLSIGRNSRAYGMKPYFRLNPLNPELNPICYLLALLAHHFLHVSRIRVKSLTFGY